jgi:predicted MFS family arabinose efflux permease
MAKSTISVTSIASPEARWQSRALVWILAAAAGIGVANVYYIQPILPLVRDTFSASSETIGLAPALTQAGYAAGMLFLAPLGDLIDRRRLIIIKALLLIAALIVVAAAPTLVTLLAASVAVGILGSVGQDFIPVAAHIAPDARRGRIVGIATTGLLAGILLSRTLSGIIADILGWRAVYWMAAGLVALTAATVRRVLPSFPPTGRGGYGALLRSLAPLIQKHPALRKAALTQGLLAVALGAFWSTLAPMLAQAPFHLGASVAGSFGFAGAAGALGSSLFGHLADRTKPDFVIQLGCALVVLAFGGMILIPASIPTLVVGAVLFDLGVMAGLASHQAIINGLDSTARSRLNGLLMTAAMISRNQNKESHRVKFRTPGDGDDPGPSRNEPPAHGHLLVPLACGLHAARPTPPGRRPYVRCRRPRHRRSSGRSSGKCI